MGTYGQLYEEYDACPDWCPVNRTSTKTPEPAITDAGPVPKTYPLEENDSVKLMQQRCDTIGHRDAMPGFCAADSVVRSGGAAVQRQSRWFHSCVPLVERPVLSPDAQPRRCCSFSGRRREEL